MKKQRWILLPIVLALLVLGWFLSTDDNNNKSDKVSTKRVFPRERGYVRHRHLHIQKPTSQNDAGRKNQAQAEQNLPRDAFERAYSDPKTRAMISVQVNAIQNSALAQKIIHCREQDGSPAYAQIKDELGIDIGQDIDRLAIGENVVVMSGFFSKLKIPEEFGEAENFDDHTQLYTVEDTSAKSVDGEKKSMYVAKVDDQILLMGDKREDIEASLNRINDPEGNFANPMVEEMRDSDMSGYIGPGFIKDLLGDAGSNDQLAQQLADTVARASFSANVGQEVMMSADLTSGMGHTDQVTDLAQSIAGGIAAMRLQAAKNGDKDLLEMLDLARVKQVEENGVLSPNIDLDLAIPAHQILKAMGCDDEGNPLQTAAGKPGPTTVEIETTNSDQDSE